MSLTYLAERVEYDPGAAQDAFDRVEGALNLLLPGSDTHKRYDGIEAVGLAAVLARDCVEPDAYNPLDPTTPERVSFMADNQFAHPEAWTPQEIDEGLLGGIMPEGMGRFTVFALAKINTLTFDDTLWSFREEGVSIAPGRVGFAGGQHLRNSFLVLSGLWEVHDHIVGKFLRNEIELEVEFEPDENVETTGRTAEDLADEIRPALEIVRSLHPHKEADELTRQEVGVVLTAANVRVEDLLLRRAA